MVSGYWFGIIYPPYHRYSSIHQVLALMLFYLKKSQMRFLNRKWNLTISKQSSMRHHYLFISKFIQQARLTCCKVILLLSLTIIILRGEWWHSNNSPDFSFRGLGFKSRSIQSLPSNQKPSAGSVRQWQSSLSVLYTWHVQEQTGFVWKELGYRTRIFFILSLSPLVGCTCLWVTLT